ncbi:MAG: transporter substrate-binding domain-containing protein [Oscillospiraceae bacterium]|jgi:putative glutamine transport system substrate-binding protein|nr:transporter substrate-binding domain-containing protein [Oscillospiraceae bacterium]
MKKRILLLVLALAMVASAAALTACKKDEGDTADAVSSIRDRGVLNVGVKSDVPNFGLLNTETNEYVGMEIDLAKKLALEIFGDETKVKFTPVTAATRGPLLDTGDIDMVIATFTIKPERLESWNFSTPYYTDHVGILVKTDAGYKSLADLDGKSIGVAQAATSRDAIQAAADELGITVSFQEFASYPEIKAALDSKRVDAFSVDKSILSGYLDASVEILPDDFSPQDYGIATKLTNKELAAWVDDLVTTWLDDGTFAAWRANYPGI